MSVVFLFAEYMSIYSYLSVLNSCFEPFRSKCIEPFQEAASENSVLITLKKRPYCQNFCVVMNFQKRPIKHNNAY